MDDFFSFKVMGVQSYGGKFGDPLQNAANLLATVALLFMHRHIYEIDGA